MKEIVDIALHDLRVFLRDKSAYIWLLAMPLAFSFFLGFVMQGGSGDPKNDRPELVVVNHDEGFMSALFLEVLGSEGLNVVFHDSETDAKRGLKIPADFTEKILSKEQSVLDFFKVGSGGGQRAFLSQVVLGRATVAFNGYLLEAGTSDEFGGDLTEDALRAVMAKENLLGLDARFAGKKPIPVGFNQSIPGNLVMYLMLNLIIFGGAGIAAERRSGTLRRISVFPISKAQLLVGKLLGLMLLACVQIFVFMLLGQFAFGMNMGENLLGILITLLVLPWVSGSLGLLVGFLIKSEEKVVGLSLGVVLPLGALGGCWWPLEIVSEPLQNLALFLPTGLALDALHQLITFGGSFPSVIRAAGSVIAFWNSGQFGSGLPV